MSDDTVKCFVKECTAPATWECLQHYQTWRSYCDKHLGEHMTEEELFEIRPIRRSMIGTRKGK